MTSRWIRLDTTWSQSEWVSALEPEARLAWIELLCHVKAHGYAGSVKRLTPAVAARLWSLRVTAVTVMEQAAIADEALVVDADEWVVTGWSTRQTDPKAAERMRRYRERQQALTEESPTADVTRNTRNVTGGLPTETKTGTKTETTKNSDGGPSGTPSEWPVVPPKDSSGRYVYPARFVAILKAYPARDGSNPPLGAYKAVRARIATGANPDDLLAAAGHYRDECESRDSVGTSYVQQGKTFFGPNEPWLEYIEPPTNGKAARKPVAFYR